MPFDFRKGLSMSDAQPQDELSKEEAKKLIDMIAEVERQEDDAQDEGREQAKSAEQK